MGAFNRDTGEFKDHASYVADKVDQEIFRLYLKGQDASYTAIFISYSRIDSRFVDQLEGDLKKHGLSLWIDRSNLQGGQDWVEMIQSAIKGCQILILILSPDAVNSPWVQKEYRYALEQGKIVIPIICRPGFSLPVDLASIQTIDFYRDYSKGFNDLLKSIR